MRAVKIGNDIKIEWEIKVSGEIKDLTKLDLSVWVYPSKEIVNWHNHIEHPTLYKKDETVFMNGGLGMLPPRDTEFTHRGTAKKEAVAPMCLPIKVEPTKVTAWWKAGNQLATGEYDIAMYYKKNEDGQGCCDQCRFVRLVAHSAQADASGSSAGVEEIIKLQPVTLQMSGLSAYDIAVMHGFEGTEEQWLSSLKGEGSIPSVAVDNMDDLYATYADLTDGKAKHYVVTKEFNSNKFVVGTLQMFSDFSGHVLTQVFTTHYSPDRDGFLDLGAHRDDKIYTYWRSYNVSSPNVAIPQGTWGAWTLLHDSDTYPLLKKVMDLAMPKSEKGKPGGVASLGEDGKVPSSQLPETMSGGGKGTPTYSGTVAGITAQILSLQSPKHVLYDTDNNVFVATMADTDLLGPAETFANNWGANEAEGILSADEYGTFTEKGRKPVTNSMYIDTKNKMIGYYDKRAGKIFGIPCTINAQDINGICV